MKYGKDRPNWKGDQASYVSIHIYINRHYGKPKICEFIDCDKKAKKFEWALKKGHQYSRNREDYFRLCVRCHKKYDNTGRECSLETKEKISKAQRKGWFVNCKWCQKSIYTRPSKASTRFYCSNNCKAKARRKINGDPIRKETPSTN